MATSTRLRRRDALGVAWLGIQMRRLRSTLSALGVAIGISAIVAVTGVSASSRADVLAQLDRLGTNLLTVAPGDQVGGGPTQLPVTAAGMIARITLVEVVARVADIDNATVRRSPYVPSFKGGGIGVRTADPALLRAVGGSVRSGTFLNDVTAGYPVVVLGSTAAAHLGIGAIGPDVQVWIDDRPFLVVGILDPVPLVPDLDRVALVGWRQAESLGFNGAPSGIYVRAQQDSVTTVRAILARTADPAHPEEVLVSRPSDALAARSAVSDAFTYLLVALGVVALLVAALGIINVMLIAVLERRTEIGLRRALGAARSDIAVQFLGEAVLITGLGGVVGCLAGAALTAAIAYMNAWRLDMPIGMFVVGLGSAILVGTTAGAYPAWRASRLPPIEALRSA
jgi:putative ABC transport system permease protein